MTNTSARSRQSPGQPTGGQFATEVKSADTGVELGGQADLPEGYQSWPDDPAQRRQVSDALVGTPFEGSVLASQATTLGGPEHLTALVKPDTSRHGEMYDIDVTLNSCQITAVAPEHWLDDNAFPDDAGDITYWRVGGREHSSLTQAMRNAADEPDAAHMGRDLTGRIASHRAGSSVLGTPEFSPYGNDPGRPWESEITGGVIARFSDTDDAAAEYVDREGNLIDYRTYRGLDDHLGHDWEDRIQADTAAFRSEYRSLTQD